MPKKISDINDINHIAYNNKLPSHRELIKSHVDKFNSIMDAQLKKSIGDYRPNLESSWVDSIYNTRLSAFYCVAGTCPFLFKKNIFYRL